ncbi:MarR family transcriptional regulator [Oscillibacter sp.]|uniref:MarR family winged helix-turn-helix transcriptional regulator n=1 Tax=Oscillibacter sp. TaxID=1945593 RepID=UPI0028AB027D|nr:MarR family transcriptional regulator [Oscillibacter sp.]
MEEMKSLGRSIGCAAHLFRERADARMAKYDVTPLQAHVMVYLAHQGSKSTQQALGEHLRVKPSTVNGIVDRMVERELIVRSADQTDARRRLVALTESGKARLEHMHQEMRETERLLESAFTAEELSQFHDFVNRMIHYLEEDRKRW